MTDLKKSLEDLQTALDNSESYAHPALNITDQTPKLLHLLSGDAKAVIGSQSFNLIVQDAKGTYQAIFLVIHVAADDLPKALQSLSDDLNLLASKGLIHSFLAKPSSVPLARMPLQKPSLVVFCYPLVPVEDVARIKMLVKHSVEEGEIGKPLGDINQTLKEGEFWFESSVSCFALNMIRGFENQTPEMIVQEEIDILLSVLPKGTEVLEVNKCAITGLSIPFEIKLYNPLMKKYKKVELEYRRDCEHVDPLDNNGQHLAQFNLLTGVKYILK